MTIGFVGLGDMGLAMARNLLAAGHAVKGFDLNPQRQQMFADAGGTVAADLETVGHDVDAVFVMVLNGRQAIDVVLGLKDSMRKGSAVVLTATIARDEALTIAALLMEAGIELIDSPVSGGRPGAEAGSLTLMLAAKSEVLAAHRGMLEAVSGTIHHVSEQPGDGQTVKAALQAIFGCTFAGIYEALVLGSKAGLSGQVMADVFGSAGCASPVLKSVVELIIDRKFEGTGSGIRTMHKDLSVTVGMSREVGATIPTTAAAYELFQAGKCRYPEGDNQAIVQVLEEIAGTRVAR